MITREELEDLYINQKYTYRQMAEHFGCHYSKINREIRKYGLANKQKRYTKNDVEEILAGYGAKLKGKYSTCKELMEIECECGKMFYRTFDSIVQYKSCRCSDCSGFKGFGVSHESRYVEDYLNAHGCKLKGEYISAKERIEIECKCGRYFMQSFDVFSRGEHHGCPDCCRKSAREKQRFSKDSIIKTIEEAGCRWVGGEYVNRRSKLQISCCECGEIFQCSFEKFVANNQIRCKQCSKTKSSGEVLTAMVLNEMGIEFETEKTLPGMIGIGKGRLRLDFYFEIEGLKYAIEVDGNQHSYETGNRSFFNKTSFENRVKNDELKNGYCLKNEIMLTRIPYRYFTMKNKKEAVKNIIYANMNESGLGNIV